MAIQFRTGMALSARDKPRWTAVCISYGRAFGTLLFCLLIVGAYGQKPTAKRAQKPAVTITHPVSKIKVVFSKPAFLAKKPKDSAWKQLTIYLPNQETYVIRADRMDGFLLNSDVAEQWSPDGQFLSVWLVYGIIDKDTFSGMRIAFVSLSNGVLTQFRSKTGSEVTTDDFGGWYIDKPHVVKKATIRRGEYEQAYSSDWAQ